MYYGKCLELLEDICKGKALMQGRMEENKKDVSAKMENATALVFCGALKYIEPFVKKIPDKKIYFIDQAADEGLFLQKPIINWDDFEILIRKEKVLVVILSRSGVSFYSRMVRSFSGSLPILFYGKLMMAYPGWFSENGRFDYTPKGIRAAFEDIFGGGGYNAKGYLDIFDRLEDSESKEILARILLFRVSFEIDLNQGIRSKYPDYLDGDIISLEDDEVIIDLGGYVGDTLFDFLEFFQDRGRVFRGEYYLLEPVKELYEEASLLTSSPNVHYCHLCAGEENSVAVAQDSNLLGGYSTVNRMVKAGSEGKNTMPVVRLDDFMEGKKVSYIKMDIEGAEKSAISGASGLIKRDAPKLAVCLYHKYEDIRELFSLVDGLGDYKYYIRAQRNSVVTEYIMYAVPKEKQYEK